MLTFSASQLGAVLALIIGGLFYLGQLLWQWYQMSKSKSLVQGSVEWEMLFSFEFWAILFITALYYAVGEWAAEEHQYHELRGVKWPWWEFCWRVGLAAAFGFAAAGTPEPFRFGLTPAHSSAFVLVLIYLGFLIWDVLVFEGGKKDLEWRLIIGDAAGAILILSIIWTHQLFPPAAILALLTSFGLSIYFLGGSLNKVNFWKRVADRDALR